MATKGYCKSATVHWVANSSYIAYTAGSWLLLEASWCKNNNNKRSSPLKNLVLSSSNLISSLFSPPFGNETIFPHFSFLYKFSPLLSLGKNCSRKYLKKNKTKNSVYQRGPGGRGNAQKCIKISAFYWYPTSTFMKFIRM